MFDMGRLLYDSPDGCCVKLIWVCNPPAPLNSVLEIIGYRVRISGARDDKRFVAPYLMPGAAGDKTSGVVLPLS
jgi:hypothetical protein